MTNNEKSEHNVRITMNVVSLILEWFTPLPFAQEFCKGHPKSVVGSENINAVQKLIMQDRHVNI